MTDEEIVERWDRGIPPETPGETGRRQLYERLAQRIRDLEDILPLPGWEKRAVDRWRRDRRRRQLVIAAIAIPVAAALAGAIAYAL